MNKKIRDVILCSILQCTIVIIKIAIIVKKYYVIKHVNIAHKDGLYTPTRGIILRARLNWHSQLSIRNPAS